jgi:hypothetical protein
MSGLSPSALVLVVASSFAVAALSWWAFGAAEVAEPGPPAGLLGPVLAHEAHLPPLGEFERYHTNEANPFVPMWARGLHDDHGCIPIDPPGGSDHPVGKVEPPKLELPPARPSHRARFGCAGVIAANGRETLLVRLPDGATKPVGVGEAVPAADGWVLEALEPGGVARFHDGAGAIERLPVGDSVQLASARDQR